VLALQGAFREHREVLEALGATCVEVRTPEELAAVDALVLPGGESTAITRLLDTSGVRAPLVERLRDGLPAFGTCAGLIVLARSVLDGRPDQTPLDAIDVTVRRNAYGTQLQSFEADLDIRSITDGATGRGPFRGVFIRAPVITEVASDVEVLAEYEGSPVLCRQHAVWVSTFHPELSGDLRVHQRFLLDVKSCS
jgi:5'-phosphate synthase pdxT subunit